MIWSIGREGGSLVMGASSTLRGAGLDLIAPGALGAGPEAGGGAGGPGDGAGRAAAKKKEGRGGEEGAGWNERIKVSKKGCRGTGRVPRMRYRLGGSRGGRMNGEGVHAAELIALLLLVLVVAFAVLAQKIKTPYPIVLVIAGLALSFVPGIPKVQLNPEVVFLVVLPPLLYSGAWQTSWRGFRGNFWCIFLVAVGDGGVSPRGGGFVGPRGGQWVGVGRGVFVWG